MAKTNKRQKTSTKGSQNNSKLAAELSDRSTAKAPSTSRVPEFNPDYSHVKKDLTRIGALAGFFIFVLVAISFFLK